MFKVKNLKTEEVKSEQDDKKKEKRVVVNEMSSTERMELEYRSKLKNQTVQEHKGNEIVIDE